MEKLANISIRYLKGVGLKRAKVFAKAGINSIEDLLYYFPRRYEDRTNFTSIASLKEGEVQTIKAEVLARGERQSFRRRGFSVIEVAVADATGKIFCVWFNQPYLKDYFKVGQSLILYGKVERYGARLQMNSPEFEIISQETEESLNIGRIVPIYCLPETTTQRCLRNFIKFALDEYLPRINDSLPFDIRTRNNLLNLAKSLINIHFPQNQDMQKQAYERLSFEEFFMFTLPIMLRKLKNKEKKGIAYSIDSHSVENFISGLPFR